MDYENTIVTQHALKVSRVSRMSKLDTIRKKMKDHINQLLFCCCLCVHNGCVSVCASVSVRLVLGFATCLPVILFSPCHLVRSSSLFCHWVATLIRVQNETDPMVFQGFRLQLVVGLQ